MYLKIKLSQERGIVGLSIENVNVNALSVATAPDVHSKVIRDWTEEPLVLNILPTRHPEVPCLRIIAEGKQGFN